MRLTKCSNKHYYDADKYDHCPECEKAGIVRADAGVPRMDKPGGGVNVSGSSKVVSTGPKNADALTPQTSHIYDHGLDRKTARFVDVGFDVNAQASAQDPVNTPSVAPVQEVPVPVVPPVSEPIIQHKPPMFCGGCGAELRKDSPFCGTCGFKLKEPDVQHGVAGDIRAAQDVYLMNPPGEVAGRGVAPVHEVVPPVHVTPPPEPVTAMPDMPVDSPAYVPVAPVSATVVQTPAAPPTTPVVPASVSPAVPQSLQSQVRAVTSHDSLEDAKTVAFYNFADTEPVVGWLVCVKGEYFGQSFNLKAGQNFIGRALNMDVALAKDTSVSRNKHAIITYDPYNRVFFIQPGESSGLTYLGGTLLLAYQQIKAYEKIAVGYSELVLVPCCGEQFSWDDYIK